MTPKQAESWKDYRSKETHGHGARASTSYYGVLGLHPSASSMEIRRAYRELSKRYHPDTTDLSLAIAKVKFQQLNEAYSTLSNPERRQTYDQSLGNIGDHVIPPTNINYRNYSRSSKYRDKPYIKDYSNGDLMGDRPLSSGELFALLMMAVSLLLCLALAVVIALWPSGITLKHSIF